MTGAEETAPIRVMIVDDHSMVAESFRRVLDAEPDIEVVAVAGSGADARRLLTSSRPDVVLLDYHLPDEDGLAVGRSLRAVAPRLTMVMLTGSSAQPIRAVLDAGFSGYVDKTAPVGRLAAAVRQAAAGDLVLSTDHASRLTSGQPVSHVALSVREVEVLSCLAEGLANRAIAERLFISVNTVRKHVQAVLDKLEAHSRLEAVAVARRRGLLGPH